ncbi:hypothetical protein DRN86_02665, partial [Candidatus Geothermarchaeota archaeon]
MIKDRKPILLIALLLYTLHLTPYTLFATSWPCFQGDKGRTGLAREQAYPPTGTTWKPQWEYNTFASILASPVVKDGIVYAGNRSGAVYAFNAYTGEVVWQYSTEGWLDSSPAVEDGVCYAASADGFLYALDALNGDIRWQYELNSRPFSSPVVAGSMVMIGVEYPSKKVIALDT